MNTDLRFAFRVSNQDIKYEYLPWNNDTYLVRSWLNGVEQPNKIIPSRGAIMTYDYCSSMWIDYDVERL